MKTILRVLVFTLLSISAFAQSEQADNDTTATSQVTRAAVKYYSGVPYRVQKGKAPRRLSFFDEVVAASAGGVQQVNGIAPTSGNVNITFANLLSKPTTLSGFGITDGVSTGGSYTNPAWLASIPFSKLTATPTTVSGYGITDAVSTGGSYSNPTWLTALSAAKVTGLSTVATTGAFPDLLSKPTTVAGYGITDAALNTSVVPYSTVTNYAGLSGVAAPASGFLKFVMVSTDGQYGETSSLYIVKPSGKYHKISLLPSEN